MLLWCGIREPFGSKVPSGISGGAYQQHIHATSLYPSQLFESFGGLIIALIVLAVARRKPLMDFNFI